MNSPLEHSPEAISQGKQESTEAPTAKNQKPKNIPRTKHLSPDGKWLSGFAKAPGLMQYVPSGAYFARTKVNGKPVRKTLMREGETEISFTTAKLRLPDVLAELRKPRAVLGTFKAARLDFEADLASDHDLAQRSKDYRVQRIQALLRTWPGLDDEKLESLCAKDAKGHFKRLSEFKTWASKFAAKFDDQNFNNTLSSLRMILEKGGLKRDDNPAYEIERLGVQQKTLKLPEPDDFNRILDAIEDGGSRHSKHCADFVRFLAYSGCRISEARQITWADVSFEKNEIAVRNAKRSLRSNSPEFRFVPIIPEMRDLLARLRLTNPKPSDRVCKVGECEKALTAACGMKDGKRLTRIRRGKEIELGIGIERITHHDLRHLFASRCIASGVDIPTISRWLGHKDGGALAMRVYGHLQKEHSQTMAAKVTFGAPKPANVVPLPSVAAS